MKHLDIVWTGQFKKDYKMAIKRHLDIEILDDIIRKLAAGNSFQRKIKTMHCPGIGQGIASAIFSRTGYWCIGLKMICLY